ncbi:hypothetical protein GWK47_031394 [Chionoecetes opilio]|uniref:Uncharacterized protein n=1 Tax=Chionoecetes opilio TaxID=41210 RepID=A0A8J4YJI4_CHIOP|nr:hypothetical protein GWK47_031394 [Chionoecetes opilio]
MFAATAQVLGMDIGSMAVSKSTVHRAQIAGREQAAEKIVELRNQEIPEGFWFLHWDGKLLPSLSGDTEDRIAVPSQGKMTQSSFLGSRQVGFDWQKRGCSGLEGGGRSGVRDKIIAFFGHHGFETRAWCKDVFEASLGFSSGPDIGISNDSMIDGPSWIPRGRETVEISEDLVEFFATNDTASKLKDDALAFLKEALMSKNHQGGL